MCMYLQSELYAACIIPDCPTLTLYTVCCRKVVGRSQCPLCGRSRKFYCYSCYCLIGLDASDVPRIRLPIKIDMYVDIQYQYIIIHRIWVVSQASPFTRGGRVWSNSHHKFVLQSQQWANSIRCDQYFDADCGNLNCDVFLCCSGCPIYRTPYSAILYAAMRLACKEFLHLIKYHYIKSLSCKRLYICKL